MTKNKNLAGVDLAWQSDSNPSAIAIGKLAGNKLTVTAVEGAVTGIDSVYNCLDSINNLKGIAIDAPLIITNKSGQRLCEKAIGKEYGSRKASCHTSNLNLYPDAKSVYLSKKLEAKGYNHLARDKWQIECYPHPAIIEIFGLPERLKYKKGKKTEKVAGQKQLASMLLQLSNSNLLKLSISEHLKHYFDPKRTESLRGQALKSNEDVLDAILCLYVAGLYELGEEGITFGDICSGYVWIPKAN